jgi:hypothetical protein
VAPLDVQEFFRAWAPADVQETLAWLLDNGYGLASQHGSGTFGAGFVFVGDAEVRIAVDRSHWLLGVAPAPGAEAWDYELLLAARSGQDYRERFPAVESEPFTRPLPAQIPEGVSWCATLPEILVWFRRSGAEAAVAEALRQRIAQMWPEP